jgi:hypothetical protein
MTPFKVVSKNIGTNPVARAVANDAFKKAALDFQLRLRFIEEGTAVPSDMSTCITLFAITLMAMQNAGLEPDNVIRGALSTARQCFERDGVWHTIDAQALDMGLARVLTTYPKLHSRHITAAWQHYTRLTT